MLKNHEIYKFTVVLSLFTEFGFHEKGVEFPARVDKIELGSFWVLAVKLWSENVQKTPKMQFYCSSRIIYEIWIHSKNEELAVRVDKIGLGWFGVIPVKLWSENVEKTQ